MPELLHEKTATARKEYRCMCCGAVAVKPGEKYTRATYKFDGRVYAFISCEPCNRLLAEVYFWAGQPEEGVSEEDYREWAEEHRHDPAHSEAAWAFLERVGRAQYLSDIDAGRDD